MNWTSLLQMLGWVLICLAVAMFLPVIVALRDGDTQVLAAFLASIALTGFVGGGLILAVRGAVRELSQNEQLLLVIICWAIAPLFASLPMSVADAPGDFTDAYFEAASGLSTTGATIFASLQEVPRAIIAWRALLQWIGGLATLLTTIVIIAPMGIGGMELQAVKLARGRYVSLSRRMFQTSRVLLPIYAGVTAACFVLLSIANVPAFDAFCLALSTISTGGFMPRDGGMEIYHSLWAELILAIVMIIGAMNFHTHLSFVRGRLDAYRRDGEISWAFGFLIAIGVVFVIMALSLSAAGTLPSRHLESVIGDSFFAAVSALTTTGLRGSSEPVAAPPALLIGAVLIGGAAVSTAGGFKVMRVALLLKQAARELRRLAHPHGIVSTHLGERPVQLRVLFSIWVLMVVFFITLAVVTLALGLLGLDFKHASLLAIAALTNAGPLPAMSMGGEVGTYYEPLSATAKWLLAATMLIGRVEILTFFGVFSPAYWRN